MDWAKAIRNDEGVDWDKALLVYESIIACESEDLRVKATIELTRLSKDAPETTLVAAVPVVVDLLRSGPRLQAAATYALSRLVHRFDGRLCPMIGQLGTIPLLLGLLSQSTDGLQKTLLKCLSSLVSFDGPNRVILARNEGLEIVLNLLPNCTSDVKLYLLEVLSALAMLREVRRAIIGQGGLRFLVEAISNGTMISRTRAAQAIGLLGIARRIRHMLVNLGAVPALVGLLQEGDLSEKLVAANALGIISSHVDYLRVVAQAGVIPLYLDLLQGSETLGKEIAEDVLCVLSVAEENAVMISEQLVRILECNNEETQAAVLDVLWDLSGYKHSISVVRESGAIPILVEILRNGNADLREKASGAIAQLSYDEANKEAIVEAGAIPLLLGHLRGDSDELKEFAAETLINYAEDPTYRDRVSEAFTIPSFLAIQDRLIRIRVSDEHMFRSLRMINVEQFTSDPNTI